MVIDTYNLDLRDAIYATWARLPYDVRRQLDGVRFAEGVTGKAAYAQADRRTVYLRDDWPKMPLAAKMAIAAHECAHVYLRHLDRIAAGAIGLNEAEIEADALAARWGFDVAMRRAWIGA